MLWKLRCCVWLWSRADQTWPFQYLHSVCSSTYWNPYPHPHALPQEPSWVKKELCLCPSQLKCWKLLSGGPTSCVSVSHQLNPKEQAGNFLTSHIINLQLLLFPQNVTVSNCPCSPLSDENNKGGSLYSWNILQTTLSRPNSLAVLCTSSGFARFAVYGCHRVP